MSKRINITVSDALYDKLQMWAEAEGRQLANLATYRLELDLDRAMREGTFPTKKPGSDLVAHIYQNALKCLIAGTVPHESDLLLLAADLNTTVESLRRHFNGNSSALR